MSGQQVGVVRTCCATPNCRVTWYCSSQPCIGNGSVLHCCSPTTSPCPHVLQAHGVCLYWGVSEDAHIPRRVTMMAMLGGYLITLIAHRPLGLQGTRGGPGAASGWQWELGPQDTWWTRSCPGLGSGSRSRRTRGDAEAHLSREAGPGATACVAARGYTPCSLPWLRACMRGYSVFRVPTALPLCCFTGVCLSLPIGVSRSRGRHL
jgi:hypothetical protein